MCWIFPHLNFQEQNDRAFQIIEVRVLSNWGHPEYTCLYRFRVHGEPRHQWPNHNHTTHIWHITLSVHSSCQLRKNGGDSVLLCGHFLYVDVFVWKPWRQKLWIVTGMCPDWMMNMFCNLERITERSVCGLLALQRKNWTTEEAKSTSPLFVKGLLHWISPRGHQAPLSGQIHPPLGTFHFCKKVDAWNGGLQTHLHHFLTHCILVWFGFCLDHLYWALFYW